MDNGVLYVILGVMCFVCFRTLTLVQRLSKVVLELVEGLMDEAQDDKE